MTPASLFAWALLLGGLFACHSDPNRALRSGRPDAQAQKEPSDYANLYQDGSAPDPEKQEYARASRQRLRAIESRARELTQRPQVIVPGSEGDVAATLNLLPRKCDETERDIEALETITSPKWQQKRHAVDRNLANLERSLDRAQSP